MSSRDNNSGLMSNAGLVRYFDQEASNQIFTDPRTIVILGVFFGALGVALNLVF